MNEDKKILTQKTPQNPKGTKSLIIILLIVATLSLSLGMYAWARYSTTDGGTASASVAKWNFVLRKGTIEGTKQYLALTRTDDYDYVAKGLVAPGTYGDIPIVIETTGTEVDLAYDLVIRIENCPLNMKFYKDSAKTQELTATHAGDGVTTNRVATLNISNYVPYTVTDANRTHDETVYWNWEYRTGTNDSDKLANDAIDTKDAGKEMTVQVWCTGVEVTGKPVTTGTVNSTNLSGTPTPVSNGTINLATGKTTTLSIINGGSGTSAVEGVTYSSGNTGVATVNSTTGVVSAVATGTTTITMTGNETGRTVSVTVNVDDSIASATVKKDGTELDLSSNLELTEEDKVELTVELEGSNNLEPVTYSSSDSSKVTVNSENGKVEAKAKGTATITITGIYSGETKTINVVVAEKKEIHVGDIVKYSPSGTYPWDKALASSNQTGTDTLESGTGKNYNIENWYVLSVSADKKNIEIVPQNPTSGTVRFQGAQGYNNAVKLLNDACSDLYKNEAKGITARSINIEDIEKLMSTENLNEARNTNPNGAQKKWLERMDSAFEGYKQYPEIYASEDRSVITSGGVTTEIQSEDGLGLSDQTSFINRIEGNNNKGSITTATSIYPCQTYYYQTRSEFTSKLGQTYTKVLLNNGSPSFWVASRCVYLNSDNCDFRVRYVNSGDLDAIRVFNSSGITDYRSRGLFPVVSLSSSLLAPDSTAENTYTVK